jgi:5-methyltetrahydrofolate--homocysteine methyltransferase
MSDLLDSKRRVEFARKNRESQERLRRAHASRLQKPLIPYAEARSRGPAIDWPSSGIEKPPFTGSRLVEDVSLAELAEYIDWTFFFTAWELRGRFPAILKSPKYGAAARELYEHGRELLEKLIAGELLRARAVQGFWPANADGDDIVVYEDEGRTHERMRFCMLRQQRVQHPKDPCYSLAEFVAPRGVDDWIGGFAVTAGLGAEELAAGYEREHDDYQAILVKALADRLAEAYAEYLHERTRRAWYAPDERLSHHELLKERYRGIRPAFGYPACPDHAEKRKLFGLLDAQRAGIELTESCAMTPAASVSGIYLANPASRYFSVGRVGRDQVEGYARRKGESLEEVERWLAPNLAYDR